MSTIPQWPKYIELRRWQDVHFVGWKEHIDANYDARETKARAFFSIAFPGSGKTMLMMAIAYDWLTKNHTGKLPFVIVLSPGVRICKQIFEQAEAFNLGLQLGLPIKRMTDEKTGALRIPADVNGSIYTYSALRMIVPKLQQICIRYEVLLILDEPHHVAGKNLDGIPRAYGQWVESAFEFARAYFLTSGTPWRSDTHPIVYAHYEQIKKNEYHLVPSIEPYGYRDALQDTVDAETVEKKICTNIHFEWQGGETAFNYGMELYDESLDEFLDPKLISAALRTAYNPQIGKWFADAFQSADELLLSLHTDEHTPYPTAAGLIVAPNVEIAEKYQEIVAGMTGERPLLIYSDLDMKQFIDHKTPHDLIDDFKKDPSGNARWIIAIQMISEGVDIPRLKVLLYASPIRMKLYVYQVLGRVIRWDKNGPDKQLAHVLMPQVEPFIRFAKEIEQQMKDVLRPPGPPGPGPDSKLYAGIENTYEIGGLLTTYGAEASPEAMKQADGLVRRHGWPVHVKDYIAIAIDERGAASTPSPAEKTNSSVTQKTRMKSLLSSSVSGYVKTVFKAHYGGGYNRKIAFTRTYSILVFSPIQIGNIDQMTVEQMTQAIERIKALEFELPANLRIAYDDGIAR